MKWYPFQLDLNTFGFSQIGDLEDWVKYVREAEQIGSGCLGNDGTVIGFILNGKVAGPPDVALVQLGAALSAPAGSLQSQIGYGIREDRPSFGYRREHQGSYTLEQWALTMGMDLRSLYQKAL